VIGRRILVLRANTEVAIDSAFAAMVAQRVGAVYVGTGNFFIDRRAHVAELAARHKIPAIYQFREAVAAGGLMSYGTNLAEGFRQAGIYTGRILKGENHPICPWCNPRNSN
jgi:putative ABC transport system substrate-binding protein